MDGIILPTVLFAAASFLSTSLGGATALRVRDRMHLLLGFSAGAVLGAVFFDIVPELIQQHHLAAVSMRTLFVISAAGFMAFFLLERITSLHQAREHEHHVGHHHAPEEIGAIGAAGLSLHSFLDGVAIGAGFKIDPSVGVLIALAVLAHDFSDGLNTVTVVMAHGGAPERATRWLMVDAVAPMAGAITVITAPLPDSILPFLLAFFTGFFLYIGASDLLPEAREHDSPLVTVAAFAGLGLLYGVSRGVG